MVLLQYGINSQGCFVCFFVIILSLWIQTHSVTTESIIMLCVCHCLAAMHACIQCAYPVVLKLVQIC